MRKELYPIRFELRLPQKLHKEADELASKEGLTLSQLIRDLIAGHVRMKRIVK